MHNKKAPYGVRFYEVRSNSEEVISVGGTPAPDCNSHRDFAVMTRLRWFVFLWKKVLIFNCKNDKLSVYCFNKIGKGEKLWHL